MKGLNREKTIGFIKEFRVFMVYSSYLTQLKSIDAVLRFH
ncbi:hypothetical protein PL8927_780200 [Planktothrix serta PCC 8927]|uniref:Uncharacterized protein n=1 Tax=Planktothrix serta PCC 8927 TaxID=671068 RepID=A0A7Z9E2K1_9CYAN|nr:hypothetical protein PL8927_780200 [Planktothrix serta PCC 8927]